MLNESLLHVSTISDASMSANFHTRVRVRIAVKSELEHQLAEGFFALDLFSGWLNAKFWCSPWWWRHQLRLLLFWRNLRLSNGHALKIIIIVVIHCIEGNCNRWKMINKLSAGATMLAETIAALAQHRELGTAHKTVPLVHARTLRNSLGRQTFSVISDFCRSMRKG